MTVQAAQRTDNAGSSSSATIGNYTVRRGDTLSEIAANHGVSLAALEAANPQIRNFDLIYPDQKIHLPAGARTGSSGANDVAPVGPTSGPNANAAAIAAKYLGENASSLQRNTSDSLPMRNGIDPTVCCANFVSAVLIEAGQLPASQQTVSVQELKTTLQGNGWQTVSPQDARPGDVVIIQGKGVSHTEIVSGNGQMIGSNNRNPDGSQRVTYGNLSWATQTGCVILRAPASVTGGRTGGTEATGGATPGAAPSGSGSLNQKQDQAVSYFESRGWTHAQAAGIVANLTQESQLSPSAVGDGGAAYGLAQWHPDRQAEFRRFTGQSIQGSSFAQQLAFVDHELRTTEASAGARLKGASTASEAASIVSMYYERPADRAGEASRRAEIAGGIFNRTN